MIDISNCQYEESFRDDDLGCTVHYFIYPKSMDEADFYPEEEYGNVVSMCISLTVDDDGVFYLQMSPTVEDGDDTLVDVDWRPLYSEDIVYSLLDMVPNKPSSYKTGEIYEQKDEIVGFYGGKFLPMHKGHLYCIDVSAKQCDRVVVIMFVNGDDELRVSKSGEQPDETLTVDYRVNQLTHVCSLYDNVDFKIIDVLNLKLEDGSEDWDAETPLVRQYVPKMDYVYSSEPQYGEYFARAYPEAKHIIVDANRSKYPISSTMIRAMKEMEEKKQWMV